MAGSEVFQSASINRQPSTELLPVIVSASAGSGAGRGLEAALHSLLSPHVKPHFLYPSGLEELHREIDSVVRSGTRRLAVAGGDGTLHRVVNALGDAPVVVAPLPTGSGNDFCRGIGLTTRLVSAVDALLGGKTRRVDLIEVNGVRVCTVAGLGLVSDVGVQAGRWLAPGSPWRRVGRALGDLTYLGAAAGRLLFSRRVAGDATVSWRDAEGRSHETRRRLHGVMLANLPTLGAGLRLPVPGAPDDGAFELVQNPGRVEGETGAGAVVAAIRSPRSAADAGRRARGRGDDRVGRRQRASGRRRGSGRRRALLGARPAGCDRSAAEGRLTADYDYRLRTTDGAAKAAPYCCLLPTAYCLPPTAYCLLPTAYCLLPTRLLPTAYCLLPTALRTCIPVR